MRYLPVLFAVLPCALWAEDIPLQSEISNVVLYPQGATITREVSFSAPAGQHELIITDLPQTTPLQRVRVEVNGATMGSVTARNDYLPPADPNRMSQEQDLHQEIERLEKELLRHDADIDLLRTEVKAAQARVTFLEQLGQGDGVASLGVDALRDLTSMVGDETLNALKAAHQAQQRVETAKFSKEETQEALDRARQMLKAMQAGQGEDRAVLSVAISAEDATEGTAVITYTIDQAGWTPVYDLRLTRDTGALSIERGAFISQYSGENWQDVTLTLSTVRPSEQTDPGQVWPWLRRIFDPDDIRPMATMTEEAEYDLAGGALAEPVMEAARVRTASASFDGISVTYSYDQPVSMATGADRVRIALGTIETQADLVAQAVPLSDQTAFLMASITNDSNELILPSYEAMFYLDDRFVGQRGVEMIPAGGEVDLSFGPIDGLRLSRVVVDRREGDRGLITKSNEMSEEARITVENLTGESWPIRLLDHVPYSEQDDLRITWEADLAPSEQDVDDKRGVLAWEFDLPAGDEKTITLSHQIEWPEGQMLQ
ncbi:DUF4139 domain-containing protein [Roseovarius sp. 2305UL8-3]|uniref:DUF4139 domain-containing protein n=1 Tax=Roseovarius conchicola TaxID=3121636 RepID=UPI00352746AE